MKKFFLFSTLIIALCLSGILNAQENATFTVNGATFKMVFVQGGSFWMGSQNDNPTGKNYDTNTDPYMLEHPVHQVTVSSFYIGETEVTQELWEAVMGTTLRQQREKTGDKAYPM